MYRGFLENKVRSLVFSFINNGCASSTPAVPDWTGGRNEKEERKKKKKKRDAA